MLLLPSGRGSTRCLHATYCNVLSFFGPAWLHFRSVILLLLVSSYPHLVSSQPWLASQSFLNIIATTINSIITIIIIIIIIIEIQYIIIIISSSRRRRSSITFIRMSSSLLDFSCLNLIHIAFTCLVLPCCTCVQAKIDASILMGPTKNARSPLLFYHSP